MVEIHSRSVTFHPPAKATHLVGDFTDWERRPIPIAGPLTLEFPPAAYLEYAFLDSAGQPFPDPDNPHKAQNPWWSYPRAIELPGFHYQPPKQPSSSVEVHRHRLESAAFGANRRYYVYNPPQAQTTLYAHDGVAYYRTAKLNEVAQGLLESGHISPVRIVFIEPEDRRSEYWFNPKYEEHVLNEIIPAVDKHYGPTQQKALMGASLGGLVSSWLALRHPMLFQKVATQSACLTASPDGGNSFSDPEWLTEQYAQANTHQLSFYCETGQIEWLLAPNRRFAAMLADKGYRHSYAERPSGHNWMTWRQGLEPALRFLFG